MQVPTTDQLIEEVVAAEGLSDFGGDSFYDALTVFLDSCTRDARLADEAVESVAAVVRRRLANRLQIEQCYREHPEIADSPVSGPVWITGLPRTGSTALANVLSLDPGFRPLRMWEQ